jgi:hypothetical protein
MGILSITKKTEVIPSRELKLKKQVETDKSSKMV